MKRLLLAAVLAVASITHALAAGSIPLSLAVQVDTQGRPLIGCRLYTYAAGTTTPQSAYQDSGLTIAHANPVECDAAGRLPQLFFADGAIKVRLTDRVGSTILAADNVLVIGPSSGSGGGGAVDATTVLATGDGKWRYGTGALTGFVRANGRTIGSATSGATERANADCQALFEHLWTEDANLTVSGGRGASAAADWAANKTIALPDARHRVIAGLGDMGNSDAARLTSTYFGTGTTTLGASGGAQSHVLTTAQIPSHYHAAVIFDPGHTHNVPDNRVFKGGGLNGWTTGTADTQKLAVDNASTGVRVTSANGLDTTGSVGGGAAHPIIPPTILMTFYIKL